MSMSFALGVLSLLFTAGVPAAAWQSSDRDVYEWHGELVSFDEATNIATVRAQLVDQNAVAEVQRFKAGDRVLLTWSDYDNHGEAVRHVTAYTQDRKADDRFLLSVELASTATPNRDFTFRLRTPDAAVTAMKSLKGQWITVTSAHRASHDNDAFVSVKPYVDASPTRTHS